MGILGERNLGPSRESMANYVSHVGVGISLSVRVGPQVNLQAKILTWVWFGHVLF